MVAKDIEAYLVAAIHNETCSYLRRPTAESLDDHLDHPALAVRERDVDADLAAALAGLAVADAEILRLHLSGLNLNEIADVLNLTYSAAAQRLSRARRNLLSSQTTP